MDLGTAHVRRRRTLGIGYILLGIFCAVVAAVPYPGKGTFDVAMWLGFAAVMIVLGAWQIDKAAKDEAKAHQRS